MWTVFLGRNVRNVNFLCPKNMLAKKVKYINLQTSLKRAQSGTSDCFFLHHVQWWMNPNWTGEASCYYLVWFFTSLTSTLQKQKLYYRDSTEDETKQLECIRSESSLPRQSEVGALVLTGYLLLAWVVRKTTTALQGPNRTTCTHTHTATTWLRYSLATY